MRGAGCLFAALAGCTSLGSPGPDSVLRSYFEAISAGQDDVVRSHVASACQGKPVAKGAPGKVFWAPVSFTRLDIAVVSSDADRALVAYEYEGKAEGKKVDEKVNVLGTEVDVKIDGVDVGEVTRSGELELVRENGAWKVGC
ncbi:MAG: hypothetical protein EP330_30595 [Deltaproteobacteria bacterium]|nr:MAG: hypothetical protein EP330_30595 [Deltaproteobacteria bacterium]